MRIVFGVLIGVSMLLGASFLASYGPPWRSDRPLTAWVQSGLAWVALAFDTALFLSLFYVLVPLWIVALILLAQDIVYTVRLIALRRAREGVSP